MVSPSSRAAETAREVLPRREHLALGALLAAYAVALGVGLHFPARQAPLAVFSASTLFAGVAALVVRRSALPRRLLVAWILVGGALLQIVAVTAQPDSSDDVYRLVWDGSVQLHGIDPYRYAPQDPHLAPLRTPLIFGAGSHCDHPIPGGCTAINRPDVRTVYPPVAQALFVAVRLASFGGHGGVHPFQLAAALGVLLVGVLLARCALRSGRPLWPAVLWTWSPLAVIEYGNNAHIDWLGILLAMAGLALAARGRPGWAGVAVSAAVLTKLYPALVAPALLRRRPGLLIGAGVLFGVLVYLPHVLAVGVDVVGYLPGYLGEEGYRSGARLLLVGWVLPGPVDVLAGAVLLGAVAALCAWRGDPAAPQRAATWMVGAAFLVTTPTYGWYAGLLLVLAILSEQYEWLPLTVAPSFVYLVRLEVTRHLWPERLIYAVAGLAVLGLALARRPDSLRGWGWSSRSS